MRSIYTIEDLVNGKRTTTHIHNLRPFNFDPERTSPLVAQQNEQEFVVESIQGHRGDRHKRSTMEFKVLWVGFGKSCDRWEPYKTLLLVDKLTRWRPLYPARIFARCTSSTFAATGLFFWWFLVSETPHISVQPTFRITLSSSRILLLTARVILKTSP